MNEMKIEKIGFALLFIALVCLLTSCSVMGDNMKIFKESDETIADKTFERLVNAINSKNVLQIKSMFSNTIQGNGNLEEESYKLFEFIQGDIASYSSSSEMGVGTDIKSENGKSKKEIQSTFWIKTTKSIYYLAVKECVKNEFDNSDIGLLSIYIIKAQDWDKDYVYRGDGKWSRGVNIDVA